VIVTGVTGMLRRILMSATKAAMPSDVKGRVGWFDRFAGHASRIVSRAWFFAFCVLIVVVWAPSIALIHSISTWQLIINTLTTIITFLLVALLQNTQERSDNAMQTKLNAIADALSDFMKAQNLEDDARELREAVGRRPCRCRCRCRCRRLSRPQVVSKPRPHPGFDTRCALRGQR
jgi:low affinity Fe/Cu permease